MCDLYSWGVVNGDIPNRNLKDGEIIFLTDAEAETLIGPNNDWEDCIGHSALAEYYKISEDAFRHKEGLTHLPDKLYREIQLGHLNKIIAASDKAFAKQLEYIPGRTPGTWDIDMNSPYITLSTTEHLAAFEFCNRWLRENAPESRYNIMRLLEARRIKRHDFPDYIVIEPMQIVNKLLHWTNYPKVAPILHRLHDALCDRFSKML